MKIAIAGYGVEGKSNYEYFSQWPGAEVTIVDESKQPKLPLPVKVPTILGRGAFKKLKDFDLVVRTAGLSPDKIQTDGKIWTATNEFFEKCPAPIIGVTGSKGKGTTSSMITSILEAAGKRVWLVGNIGVASLSALQEISETDVVVYELSSFQLWDAERSPNVAVVLGIEPEHLDVHRSFEDYVAAKANIRRFQGSGDLCVYNSENFYSRSIAEMNEAPSLPYGISRKDGVYVKGEFFYVNEQIICSTSEVQLKGWHNVDNACAAIGVAHHLGISNDEIAAGLRNFKGLPHRLWYVTTIDEVEYYDDSIATTPTSAIAALRAFEQPKVIILGGSFKGSDFTELAQEMLHHDVWAILIGEEATAIAKAFRKAKFDHYEIIKPPHIGSIMKKVVKEAHKMAGPGSVVLLSPSAASFGLFRDYVDRGKQYQAAVNDLGQSK